MNRTCPYHPELLPPDIPVAGLISIVHRLHAVYLNNELRHLGLTAGQLPIIFSIAHRPGITQDEIADRIHIDKGTVARAAKKLEDGGFVSRAPDPRDRRRYLLTLTEKGETVVPTVLRIDQDWENLVSSGLSDTERARLYEDLSRLAGNSIEEIRVYREVEDVIE
jgi:DNA-binding MarR family transcriptional regulator